MSCRELFIKYLNSGDHSYPRNPVASSGDTAGVFTLTWNVSVDSPVSNTKLLNATVTWPGPENEIESITLATVKINQSN